MSEQQGGASETPVVGAKQSTLRAIFIGSDGLRSGWGVAIFVAMMAACLTGVSLSIKALHVVPPGGGGGELSPGLGITFEAIPFLLTLLVTWIMSKIEMRPNGVYGLGDKRALSHFFSGFGWGIAFLSLLVFILWWGGFLVFDKELLFVGEALRYGAIWLVGFLCVGLLEEYLTRGYLLFTLTRGFSGIYKWIFKTRHSQALGFWTAAAGLSVLFGLGHSNNPGESPIGVLAAGLAGFVFCLSLWRTGSLWWAIGIHAAWDWAQSFLYGVADSGLMVQHHLLATHPLGKPLLSGGTTGPEGSIFVLPVLALMSIAIIFTLPYTGYGASISNAARPAGGRESLAPGIQASATHPGA